MQFKLTLNNKKKTCDRICKNQKVGTFLANTWAKEFKPFVPMDTGTLNQSYRIEPFKITYYQPYSHYQWKGISKIGRPLKYNKEKHSLATNKWEQYAYNAKKTKVASELTRFMKTV